MARARRVLAETSPKLAAPSPVGRRDGDADDSRVLRAVAALHARGRHAELARVLSNFYPAAGGGIPPTPWGAGVDLEAGQSVMVGASSPARGTIRYVGAVAFAEGEWVGVEMDDEGVGGAGRHDGRVGGLEYFACRPGRGVFVPAATLTRA